MGGSMEKMKFDSSWDYFYALAKRYYEYHGDLDVPNHFKTINGYEEDEQGFNFLGSWISSQRSFYKKDYFSWLDKERIRMLNEIGMIWDSYEYRWNKMYTLVKAYYEYYGHSNIPARFKNSDGVKIGSWLHVQRQRYMGYLNVNLTDKQLELLEKVEIVWFIRKNKNYQIEEITIENKVRKQIEILNRCRSYLNKISSHINVVSKEEINQGFIDDLDKKYIVKKYSK